MYANVGDKVKVTVRNFAHVGTVSKVYKDESFAVDFNGETARVSKYGSVRGDNSICVHVLQPDTDAEKLVAEHNERVAERKAEEAQRKAAEQERKENERNRRRAAAAQIVAQAQRTELVTAVGTMYIYEVQAGRYGNAVVMVKLTGEQAPIEGFDSYSYKTWSTSAQECATDGFSSSSVNTRYSGTADDAAVEYIATWYVQ